MNISDEHVAELPLHHGRAELLEEIMRTPVLDDRPTVDAPARRRTAWLVPAAAAAAVAALVAGTAWWASGPARESAPPPVASQPAATGAYRVVLDAPGWSITDTYQDDAGGGVGYDAGSASLKISWYPAAYYQERFDNRRQLTAPPSDGETVDIAGLAGAMWEYDADDHTALRPVEDDHFLEVRGFGMDEAAFVELVGRLRMVDAAGFDAALPSGFVRDDQRTSRVQQVLDGIGRYVDPLLPAGQDPSSITSDQSDPYQLGSELASSIACAWVAEYDAARAAGNDARAQRAVDVMSTSPQWPVLQQIAAEGDTPEWIWDMADQMQAGHVPAGYRPSCA